MRPRGEDHSRSASDLQVIAYMKRGAVCRRRKQTRRRVRECDFEKLAAQREARPDGNIFCPHLYFGRRAPPEAANCFEVVVKLAWVECHEALGDIAMSDGAICAGAWYGVVISREMRLL